MSTHIKRLAFCALCLSALLAGRGVADVIQTSSVCEVFFNCVGTMEGRLTGSGQPCNNCVMDQVLGVNRCKSSTVTCTVITDGLRFCLGTTDELGYEADCRVRITACRP